MLIWTRWLMSTNGELQGTSTMCNGSLDLYNTWPPLYQTYRNIKFHTDVQELEFKSHGLAALTINVNRLAEACSHSSNFWELVHEHVTMLCLLPEQLT